MQRDPAYANLQKLKEARTLFLAQEMGQHSTSTGEASTDTSSSSDKIMLKTIKGHEEVDLDYMFNPNIKRGPIDLDDAPLILPIAENVNGLAQHAEQSFKDLLSSYGIPEVPKEISYDRGGKMVLPDDYPHKEQLEKALEETPVLARELSTVAALASQFVGMQGGGYAKITLNFDKDGELSVNANGRNFESAATSQTQQASQTYETASNRSESEQWFLDYMEKTPEERLFEAILREKGLTPEEYEALPPEERAEIEQEIQEEMKKRAENQVATKPGSTEDRLA
jgi:hypothetical protein